MPSPRTIHDIPTPALLLDADALERNVTLMADKVRRLGARLRPHVKTHKCIEVGQLQVRHGARGITVATLVEARDFADHGFDDITWAVPLIPGRLDEVIALARRVKFRVLVESADAVDALERAARTADLSVHTWLEVDCGYHRSGVDPDGPEATALARRIADSKHLSFDGLLTHAGHSYHAIDLDGRRAAAQEERDVTVGFAERLRRTGIEVPRVSIGSTPTMTATESLAGVDEARPGNYVFFDWMQAAAGVCATSDVAVSVLTTVIAHRDDLPHCIVDAGALAMSKDAGPSAPELRRGLGPVYAGLTGSTLEPRVNLASVSQEHGFVGGARDTDVRGRFKFGEKLRVMPNHSCLTAAMFDEYWVVRGEAVVDRWRILRGR
jgi:D-serine deaminase-like pyridoxal phosphate-dependent protein